VASHAVRSTLGQLLQQTRELQGLALRQAAARLQRQDGRPITPNYLYMLEQDSRRPSLHRTRPLAGVFALDEAFLGAEAHQTEALLWRDLQTWPERERAIAEMGLRNEQRGFVAWERVTRPIVAPEGVSASQPSTRSHGTRRSQEMA